MYMPVTGPFGMAMYADHSERLTRLEESMKTVEASLDATLEGLRKDVADFGAAMLVREVGRAKRDAKRNAQREKLAAERDAKWSKTVAERWERDVINTRWPSL